MTFPNGTRCTRRWPLRGGAHSWPRVQTGQGGDVPSLALQGEAICRQPLELHRAVSPLPKSRFPFPYKAVCSAGSVRKPLSKQRACRWPQGFSRDTAPGKAHFQSSCRPSAHHNCCPIKLLLSAPFASASEGKAYRKV